MGAEQFCNARLIASRRKTSRSIKAALFEALKDFQPTPVRFADYAQIGEVLERPKPPSNPPCSGCANGTARSCAKKSRRRSLQPRNVEEEIRHMREGVNR
jgi:hypothetical protein